MRPIISLLLLSLLAGCAATGQAEPAALQSEDDKTLYALGVAMSRQVAVAGFTEAEIETIKIGLTDGLLNNKPRVDMRTYAMKIDGMLQTRVAAAAEVERKESQAYCDAKAAEPGVQKTASGALYFEVTPGTGSAPAETDSVKLHYHGTLRDGTVFDSSVEKGEPVTFALGGVIPCFSEGLRMMKVGGKAKLVCPADTAYGDRGSPPLIRPGAALNFEVELLEVVPAAGS